MLHGLPFQGYLNHGYFNYQPKFYLDLAQANGYELLGIYLNPDTMSPDICAYSAALLTHMSVTPTKFLLLFVALRKTSGAEFQMPAVSQSDAASQQRIDQIRQQIPRIFLPAVLPPVLPPEPGDIFSGRTLAKVLLKRIGGTIRSYF